MKQAALILALVLLLAGVSGVTAQDSTGTPVATANGAIVLTIETDAPVESTFGFIRATIAPGGSLHFSAGSGPTVRYVEQGTVQLTVDPGDALEIAGSPAAAGEATVESGTAFIVKAGGSVELRNDGSEPAAILELLSASDSLVEDEVDVTDLVLARRDYSLPAGASTITLSQQTLEPGKQFDWPADPALTTLYPLDRSDAFLLTAQGFNRGTHPIVFYALTIAPVGA